MPLTNSATCWSSKIHGSTDMVLREPDTIGPHPGRFQVRQRAEHNARYALPNAVRAALPATIAICRNSAGRRLCTIYVLADVAKALTAMVLPGRRRGVNIRHELPVCRMREPALTRL